MENKYKARFVDGKISVECKAEEIESSDGSKSVVVHAPSLGILNKFISDIKQQEASNG